MLLQIVSNYRSPRIDEEETAIAAVKNNPNDRNRVIAAVQQFGFALEHASPELKEDREVVLTAVKQIGEAIDEASDELRCDPEILITALQNAESGYSAKFIFQRFASWMKKTNKPLDLKSYRNVILAAIRRYPDLFYMYGIETDVREPIIGLQDDREAFTIWAGSDVYALRNPLFDKWKGDRDVVLAVVKKNGMALKWASDNLKNDKDVVLTAIKNGDSCSVLQLASDEMKDDIEVVITAMDDVRNVDAKPVPFKNPDYGSPGCIKYASQRIQGLIERFKDSSRVWRDDNFKWPPPYNIEDIKLLFSPYCGKLKNAFRAPFPGFLEIRESIDAFRAPFPGFLEIRESITPDTEDGDTEDGVLKKTYYEMQKIDTNDELRPASSTFLEGSQPLNLESTLDVAYVENPHFSRIREPCIKYLNSELRVFVEHVIIPLNWKSKALFHEIGNKHASCLSSLLDAGIPAEFFQMSPTERKRLIDTDLGHRKRVREERKRLIETDLGHSKKR